MQEIFLSKQNIIYSFLLGILIAVGIVVIQNWPDKGADVEMSSIADQQISKQASAAMERFFQINAQQGKDEWLKQLCEISTKAGCALFANNADGLWVNFQQFETNTSAQVMQTEKVAETENEQVWKINIHLSAPLPGSNKVDDIAYVLMQNIENGWKLDRFLFEEEIEAIETQNERNINLREEGGKQ